MTGSQAGNTGNTIKNGQVGGDMHMQNTIDPTTGQSNTKEVNEYFKEKSNRDNQIAVDKRRTTDAQIRESALGAAAKNKQKNATNEVLKYYAIGGSATGLGILTAFLA